LEGRRDFRWFGTGFDSTEGILMGNPARQRKIGRGKGKF
jgi:hypothetical protein